MSMMMKTMTRILYFLIFFQLWAVLVYGDLQLWAATPGDADCIIVRSVYSERFHEVHCRANLTDDGGGLLICFQGGKKVPFRHYQRDGYTKLLFWSIDTSQIICCSHRHDEIKTSYSCADFVYQFQPSTVSTIRGSTLQAITVGVRSNVARNNYSPVTLVLAMTFTMIRTNVLQGSLKITALAFLLHFGSTSSGTYAVCYRPNFTDPYAIVLNPDEAITQQYYPITLGCLPGHTPQGFSIGDYTYCDVPKPGWNPDPTGALCYAKCNTTVFDNDINATSSDGSQQIIFDHGEVALISCASLGQYAGPSSATCENGTFDYTGDEPSCLAYCPISDDDLDVGLYYTTPVEHVYNDTKTNTLYFEDGNVLTFQCDAGYDTLDCTTQTNCQKTCQDGWWDPPGLPLCNETNECDINPCQNNATCNYLHGGYNCTCTTGYVGTNCDTNFDDCKNNTCENGASCVDGIDSYVCRCVGGYTGKFCETAMTTLMMTTELSSSDAMSTSPYLTTGIAATASTPNGTSMTRKTTSPSTPAESMSTIASSTEPLATPSSIATTMGDTNTLSTLGPSTNPSSTTPESTTITPDASTIESCTNAPSTTPESTMTTPDASTIEPSTNVSSNTPESTTATPDASTKEPSTNASPNTPESTTATPDASTIEPSTNASSKAPESTTTTPNASTIEPSTNASSNTPESTTATPDASTIETSTNAPSTRLSTAKPTTPEKTERPKTTAEPCEGGCGAREKCNRKTTECECNAGYYKNEITTECEESTSIGVSLRIEEIEGDEADYTADLADPTSEEFENMEDKVCKPFNDIYVNETSYQECQVLNFANGSIVVNYVLLFDKTSDVNADTVNETIHDELGSAFKNFTVDEGSIEAEPLDYCKGELDDCSENAACNSFPGGSFNCTCNEGYVDTSSYGTPGRNCSIVTTAKPTVETAEPIEPMEVWKVVVGVTVPIIGILALSIVGMVCWQSRHQSPKVVSSSSPTSKQKQPDAVDDESLGDGRPSSMMIMNNNGTVQEVVLPWHNNPTEGEFIFASENGNGRTSMLPMVDYSVDNNYGSTLSPTNDPLDNIVSSYNYVYQHHDTANTTEVDGKYF